MQIDLILKVLILLAVANGAPVLAKKLLGPSFAAPLDGGRAFLDGRPLFGAAKTVRGILVSLIGAALCAPLLGLGWTTGLLIGAAAMAGDLGSSFVKRRLGLAPSSRALGLDQIPESLVPALAVMDVLGLTLWDALLITTLFTLASIVLSRLLFRLRLRDRPY